MNRVLKTGASFLATTALAAAAFAGGAAPTQAAPAKTSTSSCQLNFSSYSAVSASSSGALTTAAECLLSSAGYTVTVNGDFSSDDAKALASYKSASKLSGGAVVDKATWTALLSRGSTPKLTKGEKGEAVARFQRALTASGRPVAITGVFDTATVNRVKGIQRAKGWKQSGIAGSGNWRLLQTGQAASLTVISPSVARKPSSSKGRIALAFAKKQLGDRYRYGAAGPNAWDCSGLTMKAWAKAGKKLPHSARGQFGKGRKVSRKNLKPGDLVFFYSGIRHVAIYAGNGKVIHASRPGRPVAYAKISTMPFEGARRVG